MSDDDAIDVPAMPRYELPQQHAAENRCTLDAPQHDRGYAAPSPTNDYLATIRAARDLFGRVSRDQLPGDLAYVHLRPALLRAEAELWRQLAEDPGDVAARILHDEVLGYVPWMRKVRRR